MGRKEQNEELYNYLDEYLTDSFAEAHMLTPIVFDWNNVSEVDPIERDEEWDRSERARDVAKQFGPAQKVLVSCPNHGYYKILMRDPPTEHDFKCYHCITKEIDRVVQLRSQRDWDWIRERRRER